MISFLMQKSSRKTKKFLLMYKPSKKQNVPFDAQAKQRGKTFLNGTPQQSVLELCDASVAKAPFFAESSEQSRKFYSVRGPLP